jgi:hypothetical protein
VILVVETPSHRVIMELPPGTSTFSKDLGMQYYFNIKIGHIVTSYLMGRKEST